MEQSFCAIANRESGEDLIGTASHYQTYVLIECSTPWASKASNSEPIPATLRAYIEAVKAVRSVQFLLVNRGPATESTAAASLMVYEKFPLADTAVEAYRGCEFSIEGLDQVEDCLEAHWTGDRLGTPITQKDVLICTHGMRDKCCARFGQPFFREAVRSAEQGKLPNTRLWKVSHIGGHRFAPTAITLPDGRYYGRLTLSALESVINRSGDIQSIQSVYRGWGMLPTPLQILERQLLIQYGWAWFDMAATYRILSEVEDELLAEISVWQREDTLPDEKIRGEKFHDENAAYRAVYQARLVQDTRNKICTKVSCDNAVEKTIVKYKVIECIRLENAEKVLSQSV